MRALCLLSLLVAACTSSKTATPSTDLAGAGSDGSVPTFTVGGTVSGLASGGTLVLSDGSEQVTVTADGPFVFATALADGSDYTVAVATQPAGQICTVSGGSGTLAGADVDDVVVTCAAAAFTVGGTVSGLATGGALTLADNGGDPLTVMANGAFTFAAAVANGADYAVTVATQPATQVCTVAASSGKIAGANVTSVMVACVDSFSVGGTLTGLGTGKSITLQDNGGDPLTLSANGAFTFATPLAAAAPYAVTVGTQPSGQTCTVTADSGTVGAAAITDVAVQCKDGYPLSVAVTGLVGGSAVLHNGAEDLTVGGNQTFSFPTYVRGYAVTLTDPSSPAQKCTFTGGGGASGTAASPVVLTLDCKTLVVARYPNHPRWNQYVRAAGPDDAACVPASDGPGYDFCVHAGERRALPLPDQPSCSGLSASDALGAFSWSCELDGAGKPRMVSSLYPGKRLADLLDFDALAWRSDSVAVLKDGVALRSSASTVWWDNVIEDAVAGAPDPGAGSYVTLADGNRIEVVKTNATRNFILGTADALVIKPGMTLSGSGAAYAVYNDVAFAWVEGQISAGAQAAVDDSANSRFSVFRNLTTLVRGATFSGTNGYINSLDATGTVTFFQAANETVLNTTSRSGSTYGFDINQTTNSTFSSLNVLGNSGVGVAVRGSSSGNRAGPIAVSGGQGGVLLSASNNTVTDVNDLEAGTAGSAIGIEVSGDANNVGRVRVSGARATGIKISGKTNRVYDAVVGDAQGDGVLLVSGADDNSLTALNVSNCGGTGVKVQSNNVRLAQVTVVGTTGNAIALSGASDVVIAATVADGAAYGVSSAGAKAILAGAVTENFASAGLSVTAGDVRVSDVVLSDAPHGYEEPSALATFHGLLKIYSSTGADCYVNGSSVTCPSTAGDLTVHLSVPALYVLVGKVTTDDLANPNDSSGSAMFSNIQYWASFDDAFRGWGKEGVNAFAPDSRGACTSGTCRIWNLADNQLDVGDSGMPVLVGVLAAPAVSGDVITQTWTGPSDAPSCAALRVASPSWSGSACTSQFLQHAIEIAGDSSGNDNGLCEANEVCLRTPNMGSYQGHGVLGVGAALPAVGAITGVSLRQYGTNGY